MSRAYKDTDNTYFNTAKSDNTESLPRMLTNELRFAAAGRMTMMSPRKIEVQFKAASEAFAERRT